MNQDGFFQIVFILLLLLVGIVSVAVITNSFQSKFVASNSLLFPSSINTTPDTSSWELYENSKYGFSIKYPSDLSLIAKEIDIISDYIEYKSKCTDGTFDGCGGGRWPDFKISFLRPNEKAAFDVRIYQKPVAKYFGGVEHNSFTFDVSTYRYFDEDIEVDPIEESTLELIRESLEFIEPEKSYACLWSIETGKVFDESSEYYNYPQYELSEIDGYYYDSKHKKCFETAYYTWEGQETEDGLPFKNLDECLNTCMN